MSNRLEPLAGGGTTVQRRHAVSHGSVVAREYGLAAANETVWRSFSTDVWVAYDTFVQPAVFFGFVAVQSRRLGSPKALRSDRGESGFACAVLRPVCRSGFST
jgi:hypothetical protein